jgi:hypothetical protein
MDAVDRYDRVELVHELFWRLVLNVNDHELQEGLACKILLRSCGQRARKIGECVGERNALPHREVDNILCCTPGTATQLQNVKRSCFNVGSVCSLQKLPNSLVIGSYIGPLVQDVF